MSTLAILALAALAIVAVITAFALAPTGRRPRRRSGGDSGSAYIPGVTDAGGHSGCDSGSSGDCGGGGDGGGH